MKKILFSSIALALIFAGCAKQPSKDNFDKCNIDGGPTPQWVCAPSYNNELSALGIASSNAGDDYSMQLEEATADARDRLARNIEVKVKNMFKKFKATTGVGKDQTYEKAVETVSKQIAYQTLRGSRVVKSWRSPRTHKLYVLVAVPKDAIVESIKTSYKNNKALWQKFLADKADKELDKEIEKEFK